MNHLTSEANNNRNNTQKKSYHAPRLIDYGAVSELTDNQSGNTGDDGAYPSYTAS